MWRQPLATKPNVTPPPCGAVSPSTLGRERRAATESPRKRLHDQQTEQTKCPWLHCQDVGPLQQLEGLHSHDKCHRVSVHCPKLIPNQTPMHLGRCHSCASQRHLDTMHNTPPIKERLPSDAQRMVKNPNKKNEIPKPLKSWPRTNQGINYHSGCSPSAQPIGPSTQVRRAERDYPPHIGPHQALVLQPQTRLWPHTPRATINPSSGFLWCRTSRAVVTHARIWLL